MNGSPARISSRRLRLSRFAISPLHGRRTAGSLAVCPEPFQGAPARSISLTSASGSSIAVAAARRPGIWTPSVASRSSSSLRRCGKSGESSAGAMAMTVRPAPGERLPDVNERRVERPVRARKPRGHDLDHERDIGAARAAEGQQRPAQRRLRIGGRLAVGVDRPAWRQRLAAFGIMSQLDESGRARGLVDEERRLLRRAARRRRSGSCNRRASWRRRPSSARARWSRRRRRGRPRRDGGGNSRVRRWCSFRSGRRSRRQRFRRGGRDRRRRDRSRVGRSRLSRRNGSRPALAKSRAARRRRRCGPPARRRDNP